MDSVHQLALCFVFSCNTEFLVSRCCLNLTDCVTAFHLVLNLASSSPSTSLSLFSLPADIEQEPDRGVAEEETPRPLKGIRIFSCNVCDFTVSNENRAMRHRLLHFEPRCGTCGEEFALHTSLVEHVQSHFSAKPYQCDVCLLRFKNKGHLRGHIRTHTGERPFACGACDAKFLRKHTLALHAKRHTGERPFACHLCPEAFIRKCSLQVHLKSHERK